MIRFSVLYPKTEGAKFDHDYYLGSHIPLAISKWGIDPGQVSVEKGINGPYEAAVHFTFDSQDALGAALGSEGSGEVMADVANYTDIAPVVQTSEIVG
jgi:uncharacterized protein (TIGR02118 family)